MWICCRRLIEFKKDDVIFADNVDISNDDYKPYINIIAARTKDKDNELYAVLVKAL